MCIASGEPAHALALSLQVVTRGLQLLNELLDIRDGGCSNSQDVVVNSGALDGLLPCTMARMPPSSVLVALSVADNFGSAAFIVFSRRAYRRAVD